MKAVVTGGAGFIGSHLSAALVREGWETIVADNLQAGSEAAVPSGARFVRIDVTEPEFSVLIARECPDVVYHLAAQADMARTSSKPGADLSTNVIGTLRALEGCRLASKAKLVLASSAAVFGNRPQLPVSEDTPVTPSTPYGLSKRMAEKYTVWYGRMHGVPYTILRFSNVYGRGQRSTGEGGVIAVFLERIRTGAPLILHGKGTQTRDFIHVDDIVRACRASAAKGNREIVHIGSGEERTIVSVAEHLSAVFGRPLELRFGDRRPGDRERSVMVSVKAATVLGWCPAVGFTEGLRETAAIREAGDDGGHQ